MIISLDWLSDFIKLNRSPKEIADKITLSLSEVEKIEKKRSDTILEIENKALTHRPDCFSQLGLAREIAAYFNTPLNDPLHKLTNTKIKKPNKNLNLSVSLKNPEDIPRYCTIVLSTIKVKTSPEFIQKRLISCGIRPINNVVDITNYVMLELGQPLHAYDYDKVDGHKIEVRKASKGETIVTLDSVARNLDKTMVVIADDKKVLLLGGVMGGKDSEVNGDTKTIILESATFDGKTTRITSKKVGLRTDGSTRYEKNIDPNLAYAGLVRAAELLEKFAGAKVASKLFDIHYGLPNPKVIEVETDRLNTILGLSLKPEDIKNLLERLKLKTEIKDKLLTITIPTYRRDLSMEADIAEEVARIYGYDEIPTTLPKGDIIPPFKNPVIEGQYQIKNILMGLGLYEVHLPSLIGNETISLLGEDKEKHIKLLNPTSPEKTYFKRSLIESLVLAAELNSKYFNNFGIFEVGRVYEKTQKGKLPNERIKVGAIFLYPKTDDIGNSFYKVKGIIEELLNILSIPLPEFNPLDKHQVFQKGITAKVGDYGIVGKINPQISDWISKESNVFGFELDFKMLISKRVGKYYKQISNNPAIIEDFTFEFAKIPLIGYLLSEIKSSDQLINQIDIVGTYNNSITVRVYFQDPNKSLSSKEIDPFRKKLIELIGEKFKGKIKT
ncbi:phenylalanine--tRNA ligase subunit beta [Candidatus Gottesmanbacteria bacterium]|nr:phenylalanine--tRNA ligase subunit beta [Candidatus Gottesmanbacteria bacterium]